MQIEANVLYMNQAETAVNEYERGSVPDSKADEADELFYSIRKDIHKQQDDLKLEKQVRAA